MDLLARLPHGILNLLKAVCAFFNTLIHDPLSYDGEKVITAERRLGWQVHRMFCTPLAEHDQEAGYCGDEKCEVFTFLIHVADPESNFFGHVHPQTRTNNNRNSLVLMTRKERGEIHPQKCHQETHKNHLRRSQATRTQSTDSDEHSKRKGYKFPVLLVSGGF